VFEEFIHLIANKLASKEDLLTASQELSLDDKNFVDKFYQDVNPQKSFFQQNNAFQVINELIRMKVQKDLIGKSTEDVANTSFIDGLVNKVWNFIMSLFKNKLVKTNKIAEDVKNYILNLSEIDVTNKLNDSDEILGLPANTDIQTKIVDKLKQVNAAITKVDEVYYFSGVKIAKRVTEIVKSWYEKAFADSEITKTDYQKAVDEETKSNGTKGHKFLEDAGKLMIDDNGLIRETMLNDDEYVSELSETEEEIYTALKHNLAKRIFLINKKHPGTKFLFEQTIYNPKSWGGVAGTMDFLAITPEGKVYINDWKFMNLDVEKYSDVPWYKVKAWNNQMNQYKLILQSNYGIRAQDVVEAAMIPIKTKYTKGNPKENIIPTLTGIKIGDVEVEKVEEDYLSLIHI
jgi:hypothetical protein